MDALVNKSWLDGLVSSFSMIIVSEIGDKTFFIACLMAMRHPKALVFVGAITALAAMTVLSALLGLVVPNVLSVRLTEILAVILFLIFGVKILYDELCKQSSSADDSEDEMAEAAAAIRRKDPNDHLETGSAGSPNAPSHRRRWFFLHPVVVEAFALTFVAEWGDRSQLATIALAAAKNPYAVTLGGILGHTVCTGGAVLSGNVIAQHVSMKTVNILGGALFIVFAIVTFFEFLTQTHHIDEVNKAKSI